MALNFPNNPQINSEYTSGNTTWIWNGSVWRVRPIDNVATVDQVNNIFATPATVDTLGTVRVDGTTILINNDGVISSVGGGGSGGGSGGGVDLTAFSVIVADPGSSTLNYNNVSGVFTYTPPDLSGYLTSYTEIDTLASVTTRGATTDNAVTINNVLSTSSLTVGTTAVVIGNLTTLANLTVGDTLYTTNIVNIDTGVPRWTSGSDFIIDAAGDISVSGSKITNLSTPIALSDAANKAYVDGAASAFSGGIVTGQTFFTNDTASSSTVTGAVTVGGGLGVAGDIYAGGLLYSNGSPVLTSSSGGYNGGIISGTVFINNSTASTSSTTGALRVTGGVGIQGVLNGGNDGVFNGIRVGRGAGPSLGFNTNVAIGGGSGNDLPLAVNVTGARNIAIGFKTIAGSVTASDNVAVGHNAMANKTNGNFNVAVGADALMEGAGGSNTAVGAGALAFAIGDTNTAFGHDALHNAQGTGNIGVGFIAGRDLETGNYNVILGNNNGLVIDGTNNNILICDGEGNIRISVNSVGTVTVPGNTTSESTTTGALVVSGGVGIAGTLNIGSNVTVNSSTNSTSTNSGSIVTLGGIGAIGNVYANAFYGDGSALTNIVATGFAGGTVPGLTSFTFTGTGSAATSTTTGAVRISAGLGVQGRVHAGNFNGVVVPAAAAAPGANAFVRTNAQGYAYTNYINSNNGVEAITAPGNFIVTNGGGDQNFLRKTSTASVRTALNVNTTSSLQLGSLGIGTAASGVSGEIRATNNITAYFSSDIKFKENVRDIPNALETVLGIGGKLFDWTDEYLSNHGGPDDYFLRKQDFGVVAQDVEKHFSVATRRRPDGSLAVDYEKMCALAFAAIVELEKQINELKGIN